MFYIDYAFTNQHYDRVLLYVQYIIVNVFFVPYFEQKYKYVGHYISRKCPFSASSDITINSKTNKSDVWDIMKSKLICLGYVLLIIIKFILK